jgi:hypothetical protein
VETLCVGFYSWTRRLLARAGAALMYALRRWLRGDVLRRNMHGSRAPYAAPLGCTPSG